MKKSVLMIVAAAAVVFGAFSCSKPYDDSELRNKITTLETRISALESLQNQINDLKTAVENLKGGLKVSSVEKNGDTVTIKFSDGTSVNLSTTVIGVAEIDGVYCWTVNGQAMKDPAGNVIPVGTQSPQLRAAADGTLEYSIDGGKTWNPLAGKTEAPTVEETDDAYIIHFGETSFSLPKDTPFYIRFAVASNFSIAYGETGEVKYEINGASISDDVEVGILAHDEGFDVELVPADAQGGLLKITNNNKTAESGRVIMYAANHKGKSDIKTLIFHSEPSGEVEFTAVLDAGVEEIPAAGGTFYINVKADEDYSVGPDCSWIGVTSPTRALYEDRLIVTVYENDTTEPRVGHVLLFSLESDIMFSVEVKQAAGEAKPEVVDYMSNTGIFLLEATGKYNVIEGGKLVVKEGDVSYIFGMYPDEDGAEDVYLGALFENDGEEYPFVCYLNIARDEESGLLGILACQNDEWENSSKQTIYDWQYANIYYQNGLYYITPGGDTYLMALADPIKDDVIYFEPYTLDITDLGETPVNGVDVYGLKSDGTPTYMYVSIPFPMTLTKIADLEEEESAASIMKRNVVKNRPSRQYHEFTDGRFQMFAK